MLFSRPDTSQSSIHSCQASLVVLLTLAGVWAPCLTLCRAVVRHSSAALPVANVLRRGYANCLGRQRNQPRRFRVDQLAKDFAKHASRVPDPQITQDRELIAQTVKSMAGPVPVDKHVNLGRLSNEEFKKHCSTPTGLQASR